MSEKPENPMKQIPKSLTLFFAPLTLGFLPVSSDKAFFSFSTGSPYFSTPIFITTFDIWIP